MGGGILGVSVARDAALRGLRVALVERNDFGAGTSWNSLKVVHGGLRYLQHLDWPRMRESIRERATWLRIAPHLVEPLPVLIPCFKRGLQRRSLLRSALLLSDIIGRDQNRTVGPDRKLPTGRGLTRGECLTLVPELERPDLTGGVLYSDAQLYSAERVVLAVLRGAVEAGAVVANYLGFVEPSFAEGRLVGARVEDTMSGESIDVAARVIVNAAGAAAPSVMRSLTGRKGAAKSAYSVALNIMLPNLGHRVSFAIRGETRDPSAVVKVGARQLFFVPWRGTTMIGTAHYPFTGRPEDFELQDRDRDRFLEEVNSAWPGDPITHDDVRLTHGGLLPAVPGPGSDVNLLKRHRVVDHARDGIPDAVTAVSVKFTTSRLVAEEVVDLVCRKLGRESVKCTTMSTPLPGAPTGPVTGLIESARRRLPAGLPADVVEHLARSYGTACEEVVECAKSVPEWDRRVVPAAPVIRAQMVYGVRREMARCSSDLVFRRTEIGPRGLVSEAALEQAASALAIDEANLAKPRETLEIRDN